MWQGGRCHGKQHSGTTSTRDASPRHLPRQKPYHKHPRSHHRAICQDKNLTTSTREPSPRHLPRPKPYPKHPRTIATAFAKTITLPQAPTEPSPRHLPRQKPCHKHARSVHHGICQDKNLTTSIRLDRGIRQDKNLATSTRGAFTKAFAKTTALPQAPAEPSPWHLPRQKPYLKHPRSLHNSICQVNNLTTSTRGALTTAFAKTEKLLQAPAEPSPRLRRNLYVCSRASRLGLASGAGKGFLAWTRERAKHPSASIFNSARRRRNLLQAPTCELGLGSWTSPMQVGVLGVAGGV